jgi:hypothetical protein
VSPGGANARGGFMLRVGPVGSGNQGWSPFEAFAPGGGAGAGAAQRVDRSQLALAGLAKEVEQAVEACLAAGEEGEDAALPDDVALEGVKLLTGLMRRVLKVRAGVTASCPPARCDAVLWCAVVCLLYCAVCVAGRLRCDPPPPPVVGRAFMLSANPALFCSCCWCLYPHLRRTWATTTHPRAAP